MRARASLTLLLTLTLTLALQVADEGGGLPQSKLRACGLAR